MGPCGRASAAWPCSTLAAPDDDDGWDAGAQAPALATRDTLEARIPVWRAARLLLGVFMCLQTCMVLRDYRSGEPYPGSMLEANTSVRTMRHRASAANRPSRTKTGAGRAPRRVSFLAVSGAVAFVHLRQGSRASVAGKLHPGPRGRADGIRGRAVSRVPRRQVRVPPIFECAIA